MLPLGSFYIRDVVFLQNFEVAATPWGIDIGNSFTRVIRQLEFLPGFVELRVGEYAGIFQRLH
jgi:hypothetical protein